jgi:hypothetical protein
MEWRPDLGDGVTASAPRRGKIFLVVGRAGEYEERLDWNVVAFDDAAEAEAFRARCQREGDRLFAAWQAAIGASEELPGSFPKLGRNRFDPFFSRLTDRASYGVQVVAFRMGGGSRAGVAEAGGCRGSWVR